MANYQITAPDGTKYQITAPDDATQEQVLAYAQSQHIQSQPKANRDAGSRLLGGVDGDLNTFANMAGAVPAGLAGIGGTVYGAIKGALTPGESASNEAANYSGAAMNAVQSHIPQFAPTDQRTREGQQAAQQGIGAVLNAPAKAVDYAYTKYRQGLNAALPASMRPSLAQQAQDEASIRGLLDVGTNLAMMRALPGKEVKLQDIPGKAD